MKINDLSIHSLLCRTDITASVDIRIGSVNATKGAFIAARVDKGGCGAFATEGIFLFIFPQNNNYILSNDLARTMTLASGKLNNAQGWNAVTLSVKGGNAVGMLNGKVIVNTTIPTSPANGFVGLGTDSWGLADFDNLKVQSNGPSKTVEKDNKLYFVSGVH